MASVVVLPAPFGPTRPNMLPRGTSRSTPATATTAPKRLASPRSCTARDCSYAVPTRLAASARPGRAVVRSRTVARGRAPEGPGAKVAAAAAPCVTAAGSELRSATRRVRPPAAAADRLTIRSASVTPDPSRTASGGPRASTTSRTSRSDSTSTRSAKRRRASGGTLDRVGSCDSTTVAYRSASSSRSPTDVSPPHSSAKASCDAPALHRRRPQRPAPDLEPHPVLHLRHGDPQRGPLRGVGPAQAHGPA